VHPLKGLDPELAIDLIRVFDLRKPFLSETLPGFWVPYWVQADFRVSTRGWVGLVDFKSRTSFCIFNPNRGFFLFWPPGELFTTYLHFMSWRPFCSWHVVVRLKPQSSHWASTMRLSRLTRNFWCPAWRTGALPAQVLRNWNSNANRKIHHLRSWSLTTDRELHTIKQMLKYEEHLWITTARATCMERSFPDDWWLLRTTYQ